MIEIQELSKFYDSFAALYRVNLSIKEGELFGLLGPNGAGKSTLLNILATLTLPSKGSARVDGLDIQKQREEIKNIIGYMGDTPFLYGKLNAFEFLSFVGSLYSIPGNELTKRVDILLDLLGLKEKCYYLIETYSFGMKRKLSFAASVIHKPKVLLLDEPLDGVDPESAFVIKSILKSFTRNGGTVILATHVLEVAQKICTRLGIINRGEFIALGTMEEIKKSSSFTELEDIFLELTGGERYRDILDYLGKEENLYNLF